LQQRRPTYEVQINGESFLVEANRQVKLESKAKPGVSLHCRDSGRPHTTRSAETPSSSTYDLPAKVESGVRGENRSCGVTHELGFSVSLSDLGRTLDSNLKKKAFGNPRKIGRDDVARQESAGARHQRTPRAKLQWIARTRETIRYRDAKGLEHVCLAYVLAGP